MERITLNKRYQIIEKIGGGGMAEVYHGYDTFLNRDVAIKVLKDKYIQDKAFIERFRQEARSAAKLLHPNIVNVYDVGAEDDYYYIVMEYVVGQNLKEYIQEQGALDQREALHIAEGIASALTSAHLHGVIHCDIKSHNILIDHFGGVKVTDFGIAKAINQVAVQVDNTVIGSVYYLSPEQACGKTLTPQSDLYSLGVILFEMLTGVLPFDADTPMDVALQHVRSTIPSPRLFKPELPMLLDSIVTKALAKDPCLRYKSAQEFSKALQSAEKVLFPDKGKSEHTTVLPVVADTPFAGDDADDETMVISKADMLNELTNRKVPLQEAPKPKQYGGKKIWILVIAAMLVLLGVMYAVDNVRKGDVTVPAVEGKTIVEAEEAITKNKLTYVLSEEYSETVEAGRISLQSPAAGERVKEGRQVRLMVSKGLETGVVPDLKTKTLSEAKTILQQAKLQLGKVSMRFAKGVPASTIIDQSISPKTKVAAKTKIDLVVNIAANQTVVPNVVNNTLANATAILRERSLKLGTITRIVSKQKENTVLAINPSAGAIVDKDSAVSLDIAVSINAKSIGTTLPGSIGSRIEEFIVPNGAGQQQVVLVLINDRGTRNIYGNLLQPGARIRKRIEIAGNTRVLFYSNGVLVEDRAL